jgi:hypothetical protein
MRKETLYFDTSVPTHIMMKGLRVDKMQRSNFGKTPRLIFMFIYQRLR